MKIKCNGYRPSYTNKFAAGLDLRSNEEKILDPGESYKFNSQISIELPPNRVGLLVARSGLSLKYKVRLANDIGIIDEDYRNEIGIILVNENDKAYKVEKGDRIAQLVIVPYEQVELEYVRELSQTSRKGGFGSTGR